MQSLVHYNFDNPPNAILFGDKNMFYELIKQKVMSLNRYELIEFIGHDFNILHIICFLHPHSIRFLDRLSPEIFRPNTD